MPQPVMHLVEPHALLQEGHGAGVLQGVELAEVALDARRGAVPAHQPVEHGAIDGRVLAAGEDRPRMLAAQAQPAPQLLLFG